MNEKAVRLARRINRAAGTLEKKREGAKLPHKVPRKVKAWWDALDHKTKGRASKHWRAVPRKPHVPANPV